MLIKQINSPLEIDHSFRQAQSSRTRELSAAHLTIPIPTLGRHLILPRRHMYETHDDSQTTYERLFVDTAMGQGLILKSLSALDTYCTLCVVPSCTELDWDLGVVE